MCYSTFNSVQSKHISCSLMLTERWQCLCFSLQREISTLLANSRSTFADVIKLLDWRLKSTITITEFTELLRSIAENSSTSLHVPSSRANLLSVKELADMLSARSEVDLQKMLSALFSFHNHSLITEFPFCNSEWLLLVEKLFNHLDCSSKTYLTVHDVIYLSILSFFQSISINFDPDDVISSFSLSKKTVTTITLFGGSNGILTLNQFKRALLSRSVSISDLSKLINDLLFMISSMGCGNSLLNLWKLAVDDVLPAHDTSAGSLKLYLLVDAPVLFFNCGGCTDAQISALLLGHFQSNLIDEKVESCVLKVVTAHTFLIQQLLDTLANNENFIKNFKKEVTKEVKKEEISRHHFEIPMSLINNQIDSSTWTTISILTDGIINRHAFDTCSTSSCTSVTRSVTSNQTSNQSNSSISRDPTSRHRRLQSKVEAVEIAREIGLEINHDVAITPLQLKTFLKSKSTPSVSSRSIGIGTQTVPKRTLREAPVIQSKMIDDVAVGKNISPRISSGPILDSSYSSSLSSISDSELSELGSDTDQLGLG
ncbi:hypothetical protein RCL1_002882 [Eukaryota sp. TZLM3-RCL]